MKTSLRPGHIKFWFPPWGIVTLLVFSGCATGGIVGWDDSGNQTAMNPIPLREISGPNNTLHDPLFGISVTYPMGWSIRQANRWGNNENTIRFESDRLTHLTPSLYYADRPVPPTVGNEEAVFRDNARRKAEMRLKSGLKNYTNVPESFVFKRIGGRPAMSYLAVYSANGKGMAEYFTRIMGEKTGAMFFMRGSLAEIEALAPTIDAMMETVRLP